ncbi:unnamed protein product [Calypogeia fissa]
MYLYNYLGDKYRIRSPPSASGSPTEVVGVSPEFKDRRKPSTKTIISPSSIPKTTQARDVTLATTTSPPREDIPMPTYDAEPYQAAINSQ